MKSLTEEAGFPELLKKMDPLPNGVVDFVAGMYSKYPHRGRGVDRQKI